MDGYEGIVKLGRKSRRGRKERSMRRKGRWGQVYVKVSEQRKAKRRNNATQQLDDN